MNKLNNPTIDQFRAAPLYANPVKIEGTTKSRIETSLDDVAAMAACVHEAACDLNRRLERVMTPPSPDKVSDSTASDPVRHSPMVESLASLVEYLSETNAILRRTIDRLEL